MNVLGQWRNSVFSIGLLICLLFFEFHGFAKQSQNSSGVTSTSEPPVLLDPEPQLESQSESEPSTPPLEVKLPEPSDDLGKSKLSRAKNDYSVDLLFSPLDLLIPFKYGLTLAWQQDHNTSYEIEYIRGSLAFPIIIDDLGKMRDQRLSVFRRSYFDANSFNISYGITYFEFSASLGSRYLNSVSGGLARSVDVVGSRALGFHLATGNKWYISKNFTLGVDWISWSQPVVLLEQDSEYLDYANDPSDREKVHDFLSIISYFPRFAFIKIQLGYAF